MKRRSSYEEAFKSKKPSRGPIREPGPATSTSTHITSTTDFTPSIPSDTSHATASAQVTAGGSVSVQLRPFICEYLLIVIEQTAHNLGVYTPVSALEISDLPLVSLRRQLLLNNH
jgi:hypothetical protein